MNLFPRITVTRSAALVEQRSITSVEELADASSTNDPSAIFAATGGRRITEQEIADLQRGVREIARATGYPGTSAGQGRNYGEFDSQTAEYLFETMEIAPAEAARTEVWSFMGCVLLPDVVRWRFPGSDKGTITERFAGNGGVVRNTFGRLWWRAAVLKDLEHEEPFHLINDLGEDELVQIMERPHLSGFPRLAVAMGNALLQAESEGLGGVARSEVMRELPYRLVRLRTIISFESLSDTDLIEMIQSEVSASVFALSGGVAGTQEAPPELVEQSGSAEEAARESASENGVGSTDRLETIELTRENVGSYLQELNFDVRDRLDLGGNLWIVGDEQLATVVQALSSKGLRFAYREDGGRGTGYQSAWLLQGFRPGS